MCILLLKLLINLCIKNLIILFIHLPHVPPPPIPANMGGTSLAIVVSPVANDNTAIICAGCYPGPG